MKQQWTTNDIDVRMPEENDLETNQAVNIYSKKLAKINYLEKKLIQSAQMKKEGATNDQIKAKENNTTIPDQKDSLQTVPALLELYKNQISISKNIGSKSALIYEIQKLLNSQGYAIPLDGVFAQITSTALADFESKSNLYPDGKIDILSFNALMRR